MTADPFDAVWPADGPDIVTALAAVRDDPAPQAPLAQQPGRDQLRRPRFTPHQSAPRPWRPPASLAMLAQIADDLRHLDDKPAAITLVPETPVADDGRLRNLLARMAAYSADVTEPLFMDTCEQCGKEPCARHAAQLDESAMFRRLALALGAAASDKDAFALAAAAASGHREMTGPAWPGQRDRSVGLLTKAESAAMPDTDGCCTEEAPCADHAKDQEVAGFVGAIRDAAIDAGSPAEAAVLITEVITGGEA